MHAAGLVLTLHFIREWGVAFGTGVAVGAIGAAAASPYYYGPAQCGYDPYPPCY